MSSNHKPASRGRRYGVAAAACLLAALTLIAGAAEAGAVGTQQEAKPQREAKRPNIVMIMTDDQAKSTMSPEVMPNLYTKLMAAGTSFSDYTVTTPLCCPSRAAYMTGQYGHNNGILRNFYPDLREKKNVLPTWLQRQGYSTAHVGKFLNGYEEGELGPAAVAPGWDLWFTQLERRKYYDWKASKNGEVVHYGTDDKDQATTVTSKFAVNWTERLVKKKDPFYLQADYYAPHTAPGRDTRCQAAPVPEAEDEGLYDGYPLPHPPSFNQADVSEMPTFIRDKPLLTGDEIAKITQHYRCALEALHGVDRGIGEIYDAVAAAGELNKTIFVFTSDNGYFYGEHRIIKGKPYPYAENINMPLTIRVPPRYRDQAAADRQLRRSGRQHRPGADPARAGRRQALPGAGTLPGDGRPLADAADRGDGRVSLHPRDRARALQLRFPRRPLGRQHLRLLLARGHRRLPARRGRDVRPRRRSLPAQRPAADDGGHAQRRAAGQARPQDAPARRLRRHPRPRPEAGLSGHYCE